MPPSRRFRYLEREGKGAKSTSFKTRDDVFPLKVAKCFEGRILCLDSQIRIVRARITKRVSIERESQLFDGLDPNEYVRLTNCLYRCHWSVNFCAHVASRMNRMHVGKCTEGNYLALLLVRKLFNYLMDCPNINELNRINVLVKSL